MIRGTHAVIRDINVANPNECPMPQSPELAPPEVVSDLPPEFALSTWLGEGEDRAGVDIIVHTKAKPTPLHHASQALLYGLAILSLDKRGIIADEIEALLKDGPINEQQAVEHINLLLTEDANHEPV